MYARKQLCMKLCLSHVFQQCGAKPHSHINVGRLKMLCNYPDQNIIDYVLGF